MKRYIKSAIAGIEDESPRVKALIARDSSIDPQLLYELSKFDDYSIREGVAKNPNIPEDLIEYLSDDESVKVLCALASNPATPPEILDKLADKGKDSRRGDEFLVRWKVAKNPNVTDETLEKLSHDDVYTVMRVARSVKWEREKGK